jgi:rhamnose transport system substrate-binding protein
MSLLKKLTLASAAAALMLGMATSGAMAENLKIALLVKNLGNGFFDAANKGAQEAAKELGNVDIIYTGPTQATPEGQIDIINQLVSQKVNAIAVSANDADALVPALQAAMKAGVTVISFDSGVSKDGRQMNLLASATDLIGDQNLKMANDLLNGQKGDVAILSATSTATNQNAWIDVMKKDAGKYPNVNLTTVVYGDDKQDKSYTEAKGLIDSDPNLKVIIAPTTVGIAAAAQYVEDNKLVGKVLVTGLGLPSEMINHVKSGAAPQFALWNPIDLGYAAVTIAYNIATGKEKPVAGGTLSMGRLGKVTLDDDLSGPMAPPFVFDSKNIDEFSKVY